jgi:predicted nuclease of restriction endonuclease-like (RecB) superfamily
MGAWFSFIGRQFPIRAGTKDSFIDLLFYHASLPTIEEIEREFAGLKTKGDKK